MYIVHDEEYRVDNRALGNTTRESMKGREVVITFNTKAVASPGFGARRGTKVRPSGCLHQVTVDIIVTVTLCIGQSALKKNNCCKSRGGGHVLQCPIAGDASARKERDGKRRAY